MLIRLLPGLSEIEHHLKKQSDHKKMSLTKKGNFLKIYIIFSEIQMILDIEK